MRNTYVTGVDMVHGPFRQARASMSRPPEPVPQTAAWLSPNATPAHCSAARAIAVWSCP